MKLDKQGLKQKVSENITDNEILIPLLEDIEDSFVEEQQVDTSELDALNQQIADLETKYTELEEKYKQRFLGGVSEEAPKTEELPKENDVIDVKEI